MLSGKIFGWRLRRRILCSAAAAKKTKFLLSQPVALKKSASGSKHTYALCVLYAALIAFYAFNPLDCKSITVPCHIE